MSKLWTMALRNLFRSRRRSLITASATAFALIAVLVYTALIRGYLDKLEASAVDMNLGAVQLHAPDYLDSPSIYKTIPKPDALLKALEAKGMKASARLYGMGLAAHEKSSAGVRLTGVDARREAATVTMPQHLLLGQWLAADKPQGVVLGRMLADTLGVKLGAELVLVSQAADGSTANDLFTVRGVLKTVSEDIDRSALYMNESAYREFMMLDGGTHEIVVARDKRYPDPALQKAALQTLSEGLEAKTWRELVPALSDMMNSAEAFMLPTMILFYIAVGILVLNAMLMAVYERIREYRVLKAIGMSGGKVFLLLQLETLCLTALSVAGGLALGVPLVVWLSHVGIDMRSFGEAIPVAGVAMDSLWKPTLEAEGVIQATVSLIVLSLAASLYPAFKAMRTSPADALRQG